MDTPTYQLGDVVLWHQIEMVVVEIKADGQIEALSPTLRVSAMPNEFEPST